MSQTYFANIRRWCGVMAIAVPLLWWSAFLIVALGGRFWAVIPWVAGIIGALSFPLRPGCGAGMKMRDEEGSPAPEGAVCGRWLPRVGMWLIYFWLLQQPEFSSFLDRVFKSGHALRQWPIVAASLILLGTAMCRNWRAVRQLSDEDIYEFYSEKKGKR